MKAYPKRTDTLRHRIELAQRTVIRAMVAEAETKQTPAQKLCEELAMLRAKFVAKDKGARGGTVANEWGKALKRALLAEIPNSTKAREVILDGARRAASELSRRNAP